MDRLEMERNIERFGQDEYERLLSQSKDRKSEYESIADTVQAFFLDHIDFGDLYVRLVLHRDKLVHILSSMEKAEIMWTMGNYVIDNLTSAIVLFYVSADPEQVSLELTLSRLEVQALITSALETIFQSSVKWLEE